MRLGRFHIQMEKLPFLQIFMVGLAVGILGMSFGRSILLENTGLLDEYTLYSLKYMSVDGKALFYYVLRERLGSVVILAVLSTTYLGLFLCVGVAFWYGMAAGAFLAAAVIRYGLKGVLLAVVSIFPQYLVYIPVLFHLLIWCEMLCRGIYFQKNFRQDRGNMLLKSKYIMQLVMLILLMVVGCVLESFINPQILSGLLKIF